MRSQCRQLVFPLFLIAIHHRLVIHVQFGVLLEAAQFEGRYLRLVGELGDFVVIPQHGNSFARHGFHPPVTGDGNNEQKEQHYAESHGEPFCNR